MGQFTLIKRDGTQIPLMSRDPFCAVRSAVQEVSLMGVDTVSLSIVSTLLISFQKGDRIIVDGDEYSIRTTVTRNRLSEDYYVYEPVFYGVMYDLMKTLYRNTDANGASASSVFDLTYTLKEFVRVIIYNLNRDYPGVWSFDELTCPDTEEMTVSFDKQNCLQVLQTLCGKDYYDLDFRITQDSGQRTIHIGHFGDVITPPGGADYFEWGKGNGLYELREEKIDDKAIKTRLWVEGGSQNISSSYRNYAGKLQLPYPQRLNKNPHTLKNGTVIAARSETIGITNDACRYFEDAALAATIGSDEDAMEYEKIHPQRTGEVTSLCYDTVDGTLTLDVNSFIDNTMDFNLTETDQSGNTKYLIEGVTAKITFVSGKLAGQQLELSAQDGYDHTTKRFRLIPYTDERGLTIPTADNEAFRIAVGDKYKITDIVLPQSYIDDAEEELWYEGKQYFDTIRQARCRYTMILDRMYFLEETPRDQTMCVFNVGDYVPLKDTRFNLQKNIRITKVQRNLLLDQDYTVTLSDTHTIDIITQTIVDVAQHEVIIRTNRLKDLIKARRSWRTTQELLSMVFDVEGNYYSEKIKPLSIETSMLAVGAKSQQFVLTGVVFSANYTGNPNKFYASSGVLSHLTIDPTNIRNWNMATAEFTLSDNGGYFLYAKCPKSGNNAVWYLTQDQIVAEPTTDPSHWYFQVGLVGTLHQDDHFRDFATTYGFTRINGRTITTGRIESSGGGYTYFDLDEGEIGGAIKLKSGSSGLANLSEWPNLNSRITSMDYLKSALGNDTDIIGGLILTSLIALRDDEGELTGGISGIVDERELGNGIAAWYGGGMIDLGEDGLTSSQIANAAKILFRMDGSGYLASKHIYWDVNGNAYFVGSITANGGSIGGIGIDSTGIGMALPPSMTVGGWSKATRIEKGKVVVAADFWSDLVAKVYGNSVVINPTDNGGLISVYCGNTLPSGNKIGVYVDGDIKVTGNYLDANGQPIGGGGTTYTAGAGISISNGEIRLSGSYNNNFSFGNNNVTAGDFILYSDERKKNIEGFIHLKVESIAKARIVLFRWKNGNGEDELKGGLIAQDWLEVAPWAVPEGDDGFLSVRYSQLAAVMGVECAREIVHLQDENKALKDELKSVKSEVKSLRDEVAELRAIVKSIKEGK